MILLAMASIGLIQAPRVSAPAPAQPSVHEVANFTIALNRTFANPFDPEEVAVDGTFTSADGTRIVLPAFWNGSSFQLRFCPTKPGIWRLQTSIRTPSETETAETETFRVRPSSREGFMRVSSANPRYFELDSGRTFVPVGLNLCWPDKDGLASYDRRFKKLQTVGGNFARIWTTQERRLETKEAGLGRYDAQNASFYDAVFELAETYGIRIMFTFDDYRVLAKTDYFNAHWDSSPYNAANGGPLKEPTDFFESAVCRKLYKQRLRYLVARYSAYPSLGVWELYNEQDNIPEPGVPTEWFREMTNHLASIDPYHHIITTSYSWRDKPEVWESPAVGMTQQHVYGQGKDVDFVSMVEGNTAKLARYGKPRMIGEFGITWKEPYDKALDSSGKGTALHDALWASIMTGEAGTAMSWWWYDYIDPKNLWGVFTGISKFVSDIDFAHKDFQPVALSVPGLTALGLQDATTGETIAWLHDPASNWKNDAAGIEPRVWNGLSITIPATHAVTAEIWDTRTGEILRRERLTPQAGRLKVEFPTFKRDIAVKVQ